MYVNLGNETDTAPEVSEFKCTVQKLAKVQAIVKIIRPNFYNVPVSYTHLTLPTILLV